MKLKNIILLSLAGITTITTPIAALALNNQGVSSYPYVHIQNTTDYAIYGTVKYASAFCSNDDYRIEPHKSWTADSRGVCLVTEISATNANTGKSGSSYESSGTSYSQFLVYDDKGKPDVTRVTSMS